jgi:hypothetical protein
MCYGFSPCCFFLHPSCFKLSQEIFHPYHPLTLKLITSPVHMGIDLDSDLDYDDDDNVKCNACREDIPWDKFAYVCKCKINCSFCLECASVIMPATAITCEGHNHLLQFKDNMKKIVDHGLIKYCSSCKSTCESYGFRCLDLDCDFNLHHTCGPLPSTIKHHSHIHPVILTNSPAQHEDETDDEFYAVPCRLL